MLSYTPKAQSSIIVLMWCRLNLFLLALFVALPDTTRAQVTSPTASQQSGNTREAVVTGVGLTAEEALKNAFLQAVQNVVGAIVDSSTLIKNEEVISDKVLTLSNGYITTYRDLGSKIENGLIHRKIAAVVKVEEVKGRLKELNVITAAGVDGAGLAAEAVTKGQRTGDAILMLRACFESFPAGCLKATAQKPIVGESDGEATEVGVPISIVTDWPAYQAFDSKLRKVLRSICRSTQTFSMSPSDLFTSTRDLDSNLRDVEGYAVEGGVRLWCHPDHSIHKAFYNTNQEGALKQLTSFAVVLFDRGEASFRRINWTRYDLDLKYRQVFEDFLKQTCDLTVDIMDRDANSVAKTQVRGFWPASRQSSLIGVGENERFGNYPSTVLRLINPALLDENPPDDVNMVYPIAPLFSYRVVKNVVSAFSPEIRVFETFNLPVNDLQKVSTVKCTVSMASKPLSDDEKDGFWRSDQKLPVSKLLEEIHRNTTRIKPISGSSSSVPTTRSHYQSNATPTPTPRILSPRQGGLQPSRGLQTSGGLR